MTDYLRKHLAAARLWRDYNPEPLAVQRVQELEAIELKAADLARVGGGTSVDGPPVIQDSIGGSSVICPHIEGAY